MTEDEYRDAATANGYGAPVRKVWDSGDLKEPHTHDATLFLFIEAGEMSIEFEAGGTTESTRCGAGDTIEVPAGRVHVERVSDRGVTFLVAKK